MNIYLGIFSKKENSTAQPDINTFDLYGCDLKQDTSIYNPTIILDSFNPAFNYAYIPDWGRYYYISNSICALGGMYEITLNDDHFSSNKNEILATQAFIEYAADSGNVNIPDSRLTQNANPIYDWTPANSNLIAGYSYEYFILCMGANSNNLFRSNNFTQLYLISPTSLALLSYDLVNVGDPLTQLVAQYNGASNCIVKVMKLPVKNISGTSTSVFLGAWDTGVSAQLIDNFIYEEETTFSLGTRVNDFRRLSPYSNYKIYLPFVGIVDIASNAIFSTDTIYLKTVINLVNRQISYRLSVDEGGYDIIGVYAGQFGTEIPVSTYQSNITGGITASIGAIGAIAGLMGTVATGGTAAAVSAGVASSVAGVTNATSNFLQKSASMSGGFNGANMERLGATPMLISEYYDTIVEPGNIAATMGRPFMQQDLIGNHSGFVSCKGASVNTAGISGEAAAINSALNSGLYIE